MSRDIHSRLWDEAIAHGGVHDENAIGVYASGKLGILECGVNLATHIRVDLDPQPDSDTLVLPLRLPKDTDPAAVSSIVDAIEKAWWVLAGAGQTALLGRADRLADLATGLLEPNVELLDDRVRRMQTIKQVFAEGDWLTAEQLNALQPQPPANKAHPASDWKRRGRIFGVNHGGKEYFARYQFDALYQPLPIIKDILRAHGEVADPWTLAAWFHYPNGWIASRRETGVVPMAPKDALDQREAVLKAAVRRQASYVA